MELNRATQSSIMKGFSLLESLVALVILSISLAVLYHSIGMSTRIANENQTQFRALVLAESLLANAEALLGQQVTHTGSNDRFNYQIVSHHLPEHPLEDEYPLRLVEVSVHWTIASRHRQLQLHTIIPAGAVDAF